MNSLNLKKKIAFISSLAMLAATAAYLPADIAKQVGFGSSIVSAADNPFKAVDDYLDTLELYVTVDGKYLDTTGKLYDTLEDAEDVTLVKVTESVLEEKSTADKDKYANPGTNNNVDVFTVRDNPTAIAIPYKSLKGNSKIGVVAAIRADKMNDPGNEGDTIAKPSAFIISSVKSVETTLDEDGNAVVPKQTTLIEAQTDDVTKDNSGKINNATCSYETVDLSGLKFTVTKSQNEYASTKAMTSAKMVGDKYYGNSDANAVVTQITSDTDKDGDGKYEVTAFSKIGDVLAVNLEVAVKNQLPGAKIVVNLNPNANATVEGAGVSDKKLTLVIGEDNTAKSGLITYTLRDGTKEYYTVRVKNEIDTLEKATFDVGISDTTLIPSADSMVLSQSDETNPSFVTGEKNYKITKEVKSLTVDNKDQFVNVYTIASNVTADKKELDYTFTIDPTGTNKIVNTSSDDSILKVVAGDESAKITAKGANATTPVFVVADNVDLDSAAKKVYVQIVFTTDYELEVDTGVMDENDKPIKVKAKVSGKTVTKPEEPKKLGYTFAGFAKAYKGVDTDNYLINNEDTYLANRVFAAGQDLQYNDTIITPNIKLTAAYKANEYKAVFNANGGSWADSNTCIIDEVNSKNKPIVISKTVNSGPHGEDFIGVNGSDITPNSKTNLTRIGYELLGWSTDKNAKEPLETLDKVRPAEANGTMTLYAVWKAKNYGVNFGSIVLNESGTASTDYNGGFALKDAEGKTIGNVLANDENSIPMGSNYGTLPTPVVKGFTFDGWYKKTVTKKGTTEANASYSAVRVTSLSKLTEADLMKFDGTIPTYGSSDGQADSVNLYAKFRQNSYKIDFDLDGGSWVKADGNDEYLAPASYKVDKNGDITIYDSKGDKVTDLVTAPENYEANSGKISNTCVSKGNFYVFKEWSVTDGTNTIVGSTSLNEAIEKFKDASNLKVKAVWKVGNEDAENSSIAFNTNGGNFYVQTASSVTAGADVVPGKTLTLDTSFKNEKAAANSAVSDKLTVKSETVTKGSTKYVVARAGYTFTGWYADEECTKLYSFGNFPEKGTETTVYAGWKANTATRYKMNYTLIDNDGSIVADNATKTYMATTGSEVTAVDKVITVNYSNGTSKKFVFDAKLSTGRKFSDTVKAAFIKGANVAAESSGGEVFGKNEGDIDGLVWGNFIEDASKYTTIEGVFVEESIASTKLGTVNDTVVDTTGKVTWSPVDNAIAYKVVKKVGDKTYYSDKITATEYKFGSVPETAYSVRVVAFDKDGNKTWGKEVQVAGPVDPYAIGEIKNIKVDADRKTVTWDKVDNAVTYKLVKKIGDKTYYTSEIADTSYTFGAATQGAFTVNVVAINVNGDRKWSDDVKVEAVKSNLGAAGNVKVGSDNKTLTWSAVDNAVSYRVAKIVGGKTYYTAKTTKLTTTLGSALKEGNKVYLIAYDKNGKSVTGPQTKISSVAKATKVAVAADGKTVTWTAAKNAAKYQVAKLINGKTYYGTKVDAKTTKYTFGSAATAGTQVFVITFDADGNSSYSDAVLVK